MLKKLFKVVVIFHLIISLINGGWGATFICLFNLFLLFVADFVQKKLRYSDIFHLCIYLFLTGTLIGGDIYYLYAKVWYFDIIMHILSSFIISGLCFYVVRFFKFELNKFLFITFIFSFAMMISVLWEITEFSIDRLFDSDMQKDTVITEINSTLLSSDGTSVVKKEVSSMKFGDLLIDGYVDIGLYDTIEDMICAIFGSIAFIIIGKVKEAF